MYTYYVRTEHVSRTAGALAGLSSDSRDFSSRAYCSENSRFGACAAASSCLACRRGPWAVPVLEGLEFGGQYRVNSVP